MGLPLRSSTKPAPHVEQVSCVCCGRGVVGRMAGVGARLWGEKGWRVGDFGGGDGGRSVVEIGCSGGGDEEADDGECEDDDGDNGDGELASKSGSFACSTSFPGSPVGVSLSSTSKINESCFSASAVRLAVASTTSDIILSFESRNDERDCSDGATVAV